MYSKLTQPPLQDWQTHQQHLNEKGYSITPPIYTSVELDAISQQLALNLNSTPTDHSILNCRAILNKVPTLYSFIFKPELLNFIKTIIGKQYFIVKSIYFDKPKSYNWVVPFHQDITLSILKKENQKGYHHWIKKEDAWSVQAPVEVLNTIYTLRIHLDDTTPDTGALKVWPHTHLLGIMRKEKLAANFQHEVVCEVQKGAVMLMRPLLWHASGKSDGGQRRVLHIEISNYQLPNPLRWAEYKNLD